MLGTTNDSNSKQAGTPTKKSNTSVILRFPYTLKSSWFYEPDRASNRHTLLVGGLFSYLDCTFWRFNYANPILALINHALRLFWLTFEDC